MTKIHTKFHDPKKYEFKPKDLVNNIKEGKLFYKSNDHVYLLTSVISGSFSNTGGANNQVVTFNEDENITGEEFFTYGGFARKFNINFKIAAQSEAEMKPLYRKLNFLVSNLAPDYSKGGRMRAPYVRFCVGAYGSAARKSGW